MEAQLPVTTTRRRSFGRGFRQRSPLVLAAAAVLAVVSLLVFQAALVNGGLTAVAQGRLLRIPNDDYVHVAYRVDVLKKHPPKGPTVYLFGGSGTMEMIISEQSLAGAIQRAGGGQVNVVSLAAHQESLAMTLVIIDNLPPGPAVLAVGLAPSRLTASPASDSGLLSGRPLLLRSPRLEQLAPTLYGKKASIAGALPGFFDYTSAYLRARLDEGVLWGVSIPYAHHYYPPGSISASPAAKRRNISSVLSSDEAAYAQYADYNFVVLNEILRLARDKGFKVVLFDQPLNTAVGGATWGGIVPDYQSRARALARSWGVTYLPVAQRVHLRNADFADLYHLIDSGRDKWQPELARELAGVLRTLSGS